MNKDIVATAAWTVVIVAVVAWMVSVICLMYRIHLDLELMVMGHNYSYELMDILVSEIQSSHSFDSN